MLSILKQLKHLLVNGKLIHVMVMEYVNDLMVLFMKVNG
ncbi:unnamed protein product [Schistosoma mattheei]|uniref:Uncharacterized protein n=1 Tax=Schistosoma mattheei TaxID=31246 RepID=A0A183PXA7_9TREM|nr:unnamed protein product [Schistosoma mattheei]